ncbi:MAG: hypothetical protein ABI581_16345 [Sediminibacterium sp.]
MWKKILEPRMWRRIYIERMGEPLIYNIVSIFVMIFGSFRKRVAYDLIPRQPYAFSILAAADSAKANGINKITIIEFGVAAGAGLLNMCWIAERVTKETGVEFEIIGFDGGAGMPPPRSYKDHPEKYFTGDFPLTNREQLLKSLPDNARILFGELTPSIEQFKNEIKYPIGFVSVDVDYYWSAQECMEIFVFPPEHYLPIVYTYFDDVQDIDDNEFCGELLAIKEFNKVTEYRKVASANCLANLRIFKQPVWLNQIYLTHIFDHEFRSIEFIKANKKGLVVLGNPHL